MRTAYDFNLWLFIFFRILVKHQLKFGSHRGISYPTRFKSISSKMAGLRLLWPSLACVWFFLWLYIYKCYFVKIYRCLRDWMVGCVKHFVTAALIWTSLGGEMGLVMLVVCCRIPVEGFHFKRNISLLSAVNNTS